MDNLHSVPLEIVDHHDDVEVAFDRRATSLRLPVAKPAPTTAGDGWYHDVAIAAAAREAIEARANPYHH